MPLKHHTETAYMFLLALVIGASGFLASLLPQLPSGMAAWAVCFTLAFLYPLFFMATLRENRADYEFRALHWFPALIFFVWILMEFAGPRFAPLHILQLGLFFLWSLPLVALGIAFLIIFSLHVIRRRTVRVGVLSVLLALFTVAAVAAEAQGANRSMQAMMFSPSGFPMTVKKVAVALGGYVESLYHPPMGPVVEVSSSSVSSASSSSRTVAQTSMSSVSAIAVVKSPKNLPKSGPESVALTFLTLASLYSITLHTRARRRIVG